MTDKGIVYLEGLLDNVLMNVGNLMFPVDFVVLDMEENEKVPIILGCSFLAIARALVNMEKGELILCLEDKHVSFTIFSSFHVSND